MDSTHSASEIASLLEDPPLELLPPEQSRVVDRRGNIETVTNLGAPSKSLWRNGASCDPAGGSAELSDNVQ
jgi:hypothetical protein